MLHEIIEAIGVPMAAVGFTPTGGLVLDAASGALAALLRRAPAELAGASVEALFPPALAAALRQVAAVPASGAVEVVAALGPQQVPHRATVRALDGRVVATFRPEAAAEAGELGAAALEILDMQSEMVSRWQPDGTITYCNEAFARQCGRSRDAVIGRSLLDLTPAEELGQILANVARLSPSRPTAGYDHRIPSPDGADRWQAWIDRALFDQEGRVTGYLSVGRDITARKTAERRLAESEQRLKLALEAGRQGVWEIDLAAGRIHVDQTFEQLLAIPPGAYALDLEASYLAYHPDDRERVRAAMEAVVRGERQAFRVEARRLAGDGGWRWLMNFGRIAERDADGRALRMVGTTIDITDRKAVEAQLREGEERLRLALEAGGLGVWESDLVTDMVRFDPICLARVGLEPQRRYLSLGEVVELVHPRDRAMVRATYARCRRGELAQCRLEYRVRRRDGGQLWIEEHARVAERAPDGRPVRLVGVSADITARKEAELQLAHLALHDPLTGLPNRRALAEALERAIARAQRSGQPLAVLAVDLDGFKAVNDRHGHPAGDEALVEVAGRLRRAVRRSDLVARLGGDEFAVIAAELTGPTPVVRLARRLHAALGEPLQLSDGPAAIGASIGVAFFPGDGGTPEELLTRADAALYAAKRERVGWRFSAGLPAATTAAG